MALGEAEEACEFDLRMAQMQADTTLKTLQARKVEQDWQLDPTRVVISASLAGAATMGSVAGLLGFFIGRSH